MWKHLGMEEGGRGWEEGITERGDGVSEDRRIDGRKNVGGKGWGEDRKGEVESKRLHD